MESTYNYLKTLIKKDDSLVVAISGGPDSMALIDLLLKLKKEINLNIICAHVNHNTGRIGQKAEEEYVREYCKKNDIVFEFLLIENYGDDNFENEARTKRYEFFESLIEKYNAKYLFTAHHGDDLIETILMRIVRGSTIKGYSGFKKEVEKEKYTIIRPLIEVTKEEIIKYNKDNKIKYFVDETNLEDIHTRNRYRKYILPKLKEEDKNVHLKFYKFSKILNEYNEYIEKEVNKIINEVYKDNILNIKKYLELENIIQTKILNMILENVYEEDLMLITDKHVQIIHELILSNKSNSIIHLPNNLLVMKKYNEIEFKKEKEINNMYEIEIIDYVSLPNGHIIEVIESSEKDSNYICRLNKEEVLFPLYVRNRYDGDKMYVKNMNGSKKIKDIFIDSKIDIEKRDNWPIVLDANNNIVWLPGLKKSKFDKTKDEKYDIILRYR